jgi:hypothetical protein
MCVKTRTQTLAYKTLKFVIVMLFMIIQTIDVLRAFVIFDYFGFENPDLKSEIGLCIYLEPNIL